MSLDDEYDRSEGLDVALSLQAFLEATILPDYQKKWRIGPYEEENPSRTGEPNEGDPEMVDSIALALRDSLDTLHLEEDARERIAGAFSKAIGWSPQTSGQIEQAVSVFRQTRMVKDRIVLELAFDLVGGTLPDAQERVLDLLEMIAVRRLSERAKSFLARVTQMYLWGCGPELLVMSASVIEAALESRLPPEDMARAGVEPDPRCGEGSYSASQYAYAARRLGILEEDHWALARSIRIARNEIIHNTPDTSLKPRDVLENLIRILDVLFPREVSHE